MVTVRDSASAANIPPAEIEPCWAGSPTRITRAPEAAASPHTAAKSRVASWEASSMMTVPPAGIGLEPPLPSALFLAAVRRRATVSERTPRASPRVAAATAVGAVATTLWAPAASATRASMVVLPAPAGPTTTAPAVGDATSWRAASAWSAPRPSTSSRARRAWAAAVSPTGEDSQAAVVTSAAISPGEYHRLSWCTSRWCSWRRRAQPSRSTNSMPLGPPAPVRESAPLAVMVASTALSMSASVSPDAICSATAARCSTVASATCTRWAAITTSGRS